MSNQPDRRGTSAGPPDPGQGRPPAPGPSAPSPSGGAPARPGTPPAPGRPVPPRPQPRGATPAPGQPAGGTRRQPGQAPGTPPRPTGPQGRIPAAGQRQPVDLATRLDGQRGWLAQLDRSLKKRSIIALILTCLAVGVGASAIYVSLTRNADSDRIDALETRIKSLEAAAGIPSSDGTDPGATVPGTDSLIPETGTPVPDTGTVPDGTTLPPGDSTDGSGLTVP